MRLASQYQCNQLGDDVHSRTKRSDDVHEDASQIRERLTDATTEGQVRVIIFEWFGKYLGDEKMSDQWVSLKRKQSQWWPFFVSRELLLLAEAV